MTSLSFVNDAPNSENGEARQRPSANGLVLSSTSTSGAASLADQSQYPQLQPAERWSATAAGQSNLLRSLLMDIADAIPDWEQCIRLAVKLCLEEGEVLRVLAERFTARLPFEILAKWVETRHCPATGTALHAALCEIERQDLADRFEDELLREDQSLDEPTLIVSEPQPIDTLITDISQRKPSLDVLLDIGFAFPKLKHCIRLAESLVLGDEFVERVRAGVFTTGKAALNILFKWRQQKSREATGRVLFDALVGIGRRDVAACFAERLLGEEVDDWEDFCYDNEHRDFFRILRRRHIDVVATYECMRCSDGFLNHLHRRGVLSRSECKDLLQSSRALLRPMLNQALLNIILRKQVQLQEIFTDLLCHYQPHLVIPYEEGDSALNSLCSSNQSTGQPLLDLSWQLHGQNLLLDFKEELRRWFNQLIITRPLDFVACEDFQPVSEIYVTLSSISYEQAVKLVSGGQHLHGSELLEAGSQVAAESQHSRELLDLHALLCYPQGIQAKSAVLFGSAGSGKSLTTLKILSEWNSSSSTSPFKQFDVIVYITGRECSRLSAKDIVDLWGLWRVGYTKQQQEFILTYYAQHSDKVLFLVDAWDEAGGENLLQGDTVLKKILRGKLFRHSSVIITSRPAPSAYPLLEDCKRRYSLVGFNNRRLRELFNRRLEEPKAAKLYDILSQSSHLHVKSAVQKTPLFAAMLVQLYKTKESLPATITALYQSMLDSIRCRYVQWVEDTQPSSNAETMALKQKSSQTDFEQVEEKLSKLALAGWMSNKVTFTEQEVWSCGKTAVKPQYGLLSEVKEIKMFGSHVLYHFNHLTWQEFLAARSLARDPDFFKKLRACVRSVGVGEHTRLFWQFLAGLIDSHLLPDLVFELGKASGISGFAPWETEIRLLLLDCMAECIRMRQMSDRQFHTNHYMQLAGELIAASNSQLILSGCILSPSHLASVALCLSVCPNIRYYLIAKSRVDDHCPDLSDHLHHLESFEVADLAGEESSSFLASVFHSLSTSPAISLVQSSKTVLTAKCLRAIAQLINCSKSLSEIGLLDCNLKAAGVVLLNQSIHHSSSLLKIALWSNHCTGSGHLLGELCAKCPQLENLQVDRCCLDNNDMAALLASLHNSCNLKIFNVATNQLTDEVAVPLLEFAVYRHHLSQHVLAAYNSKLPQLQLDVSGNTMSDEMLTNMATMLPPTCGMWIFGGHLRVSHGSVDENDYAQQLHEILADSAEGHVVCSFAGMGRCGALQISHFLTTDYAWAMKSLSLHDSAIGDDGAAAIATVLPRSTLRGLDVSRNSITFTGFYQLMAALSGSGLLRYLNVGENPIFNTVASNQGQLMPSVLDLSFGIQCLEIVSATSTEFSDNSVSVGSSPLALMAIPSLSALDLSNNKISDKSIAMVTQWMEKLEYLSLSGNMISSDGGKTLMNKAEEILERTHAQQPPHCRLQQIWLGGNLIAESVFAECRCKLISSASFSLECILPRNVPLMLSANDSTVSTQLTCETRSLFWTRMNSTILSETFNDCMYHFVDGREWLCFNRWCMVALQAVSCPEESATRISQARKLMNIFAYLTKWFLKTEANMPMVLAINCCTLCVINELVLICSLVELEADADIPLKIIAHVAAQDSDMLALTMQYMSGLAERCHQLQLQPVADRLIQQLEYVSQQAIIALMSS